MRCLKEIQVNIALLRYVWQTNLTFGDVTKGKSQTRRRTNSSPHAAMTSHNSSTINNKNNKLLQNGQNLMLSVQTEVSELFASVESLRMQTRQLMNQLNTNYITMDKLVKTYHDLNSQYELLNRKLHSFSKRQKMEPSVLMNSEENFREIKQRLRDIHQKLNETCTDIVPMTGSIFVRLFLGQVNVKVYRKEERLKLKQEYQKFRARTDLVFLLGAALQFFLFPHVRLLELLFQVWLLYYYVSLSLRENILRVNGSNIKPWWIFHHYFSTFVALVVMTWTDTLSFRLFLRQFLALCLFQALVQLLQNRYQQARLYKLVAMGKATRMDVTGGEHSGMWLEQWTPTLMFLLPFLLTLQCFQLYHGYTLLRHAVFQGIFNREWQVPVLGVTFLVLGCGNIIVTLRTYHQKGWGRDTATDN